MKHVLCSQRTRYLHIIVSARNSPEMTGREPVSIEFLGKR